jgi:hypothetical protein
VASIAARPLSESVSEVSVVAGLHEQHKSGRSHGAVDPSGELEEIAGCVNEFGGRGRGERRSHGWEFAFENSVGDTNQECRPGTKVVGRRTLRDSGTLVDPGMRQRTQPFGADQLDRSIERPNLR